MAALAVGDYASRRIEIEADLEHLAEDTTAAGIVRYKSRAAELKALDDDEKFELGRAARLQRKQRREADEANRAAQVAHNRERFTTLAKLQTSVSDLAVLAGTQAADLATTRCRLLDQLKQARLLGEEIKGGALGTADQTMLVDVAIQQQLIKHGLPLRGMGLDYNPPPVEEIAKRDVGSVANEIKRIARDSAVMTEALKGVSL